VLLFVQEFWSPYILQCFSLFVHVHVQYHLSLSLDHIKASYLCTLSPLLSSISIKGVLRIDAKASIGGRWLRLESYIFYGHYHICWNDTPCFALGTPHKIFDLDTNWWGTSPYVIAWVIRLIILSSCRWGMHSSLDDHLKLRITCGTIVLHDWYHV
jgi:hypothetical protein